MRFLADENFNNDIIRGVRHHEPALDVIRVQDLAELSGADDPVVLAWAAGEGRILLTHDAATMPDFAYERVAANIPMPGVFIIREKLPIGVVVEELLVIIGSSSEEEWADRVWQFPLFQ